MLSERYVGGGWKGMTYQKSIKKSTAQRSMVTPRGCHGSRRPEKSATGAERSSNTKGGTEKGNSTGKGGLREGNIGGTGEQPIRHLHKKGKKLQKDKGIRPNSREKGGGEKKMPMAKN